MTRPGAAWYFMLLVHQALAGLLWPYQTIFLAVRPEPNWNNIAQGTRSFTRIVCLFFVPMILTLAGMEGLGLKKWARWHDATGLGIPLTANQAAAWEAWRILMILAAMLASAYLVKIFAETFRSRNTYPQALTVVIYSFAPICFMRALLMFYPVNDWVLWAFGIVLALKTLYHGLPRILLPDPPHALGLFFSCSLGLLLVSLLERFITLWYLGKSLHSPALI